jgi:hypothetical protein
MYLLCFFYAQDFVHFCVGWVGGGGVTNWCLFEWYSILRQIAIPVHICYGLLIAIKGQRELVKHVAQS